MKLSATLSLALLTLLAPAVHAAPPVTPVWETAADFKTPESVLYDAKRSRLYVSNIDGAPLDKDGKGFISLLGMDGRIDRLEWVTGLNAPKGMAQIGKRLFVADIDELVEIDVDAGKVSKRYAAAGARFLNDVTADAAGNVYVSDMVTNRIYRLHGKRLDVWLESAELQNPNGLDAVGDTLYVASWGVMRPDFGTDVPGHLKTVSIKTKRIADFAGSAPVGNLDGLAMQADGSALVSDWMAGGLMRVSADGSVHKLDALGPGSADIGFIPGKRLVLVPMMKDGKVVALRLER